LGNVKMAIRALTPYDDVPADQFGPLMLSRMMHGLVGQPGRRKDSSGKRLPIPRVTINATIKQVRRMFRWAASVELVPASVPTALDTVELLRRGRTSAPDLPPIRAVSDDVINMTLPRLPRVVADMVRVQRLVGCRPGELCRMTPEEIDRSDDVWVWSPTHHKTSWRDESRMIAIGPQAQAILLRYLDRPPSTPCFLPSESEADRNAARRASRRSPMTPSQRARRQKAKQQKKKSIKPYDEKAYCRAIVRACESYGIPRWSPNMLRHAAGEEARRLGGLDAAQARLGHKHANVTQVYAHVGVEKAKEIARRLG
jgi:integrase